MPFNFVTTVQWRAMTKSRTGAGTGIGVTQPLYVITNESDYHYLHECDVTMLMLNAGSYTIQMHVPNILSEFSLSYRSLHVPGDLTACPTGRQRGTVFSRPALHGQTVYQVLFARQWE